MKKKILIAGEIICAVCLLFFVLFVSGDEKESTADFSVVSEAVTAVCDIEGLTEGDVLKLKKQFSLESELIKEFTYYCSDSVMDVRELLIVRLTDMTLQQEVTEKIEKYLNEKQQLFEGYAPEESELLASSVMVSKGGFILFYVGENTEKAVSAFSEKV